MRASACPDDAPPLHRKLAENVLCMRGKEFSHNPALILSVRGGRVSEGDPVGDEQDSASPEVSSKAAHLHDAFGGLNSHLGASWRCRIGCAEA